MFGVSIRVKAGYVNRLSCGDKIVAFVTKLLLVPMFRRHHFDVVPVVTPDPVSTRPVHDFSKSIHREHEAMDEHARSRHDNEPHNGGPRLPVEGALHYNEHVWPCIMVVADVEPI